MKLSSSKYILDRVSKIEKKYTKSKQIKNNSEDEDLSFEDEDFRVGGRTGYAKPKSMSQWYDKAKTNHSLSNTNILQHDGINSCKKIEFLDMPPRAITNEEVKIRESLSEDSDSSDINVQNKLKKEASSKDKISFNSSKLYTKKENEMDNFIGKQNSVHLKHVKTQELGIDPSHRKTMDQFLISDLKSNHVSRVLDNCLHMNLNLNLDEDTDENLSSSMRNESGISGTFSHAGLNIVALSDLLDKDDADLSELKVNQSADDLSDYKDITIATEANSLSDTARSVSLAKEVMPSSNNSVSSRHNHNSPLLGTNINDFKIDSFYNLSVNLPSLEEVEQPSKSSIKNEYENEMEEYDVNVFQTRSDHSIEPLPFSKIVSSNEKDDPLLRKTKSVFSVVNSEPENESILTSSVKEDINSSEAEKLSPETSYYLQDAMESNSLKILIHTLENSQSIDDCRNSFKIKSEEKSEKQKSIFEFENSVNNADLDLTNNDYFGKIRGIEELQDIIEPQETNLPFEDNSNKSTTMNEDIEEDINCSTEYNISMNHSFYENSVINGTTPTLSNVSSLPLTKNKSNTVLKKLEICALNNIKLDNVESKSASEVKIDLEETDVKVMNEEEEIEKHSNKLQSKIEHQSTIAKTKTTSKIDKAMKKSTRDVRSQTDPNVMFLSGKDKEFDEKIEEIFKSSFTQPNLLNNLNISSVEGSSKDLFGPFERGFHWALKQQVEITKHFIKSEYDMYAICMRTIRELSAHYKPVSIHRHKKTRK